MMGLLKNRRIDSIITSLQKGNMEDYHAEQELEDLGVNPEAIAKILDDAQKERESKWTELGSRLVREHVLNATDP